MHAQQLKSLLHKALSDIYDSQQSEAKHVGDLLEDILSNARHDSEEEWLDPSLVEESLLELARWADEVREQIVGHFAPAKTGPRQVVVGGKTYSQTRDRETNLPDLFSSDIDDIELWFLENEHYIPPHLFEKAAVALVELDSKLMDYENEYVRLPEKGDGIRSETEDN